MIQDRLTDITTVVFNYQYQTQHEFSTVNLEAIGLADLDYTDMYLIGKPYYQGKFKNIKSHGNLFNQIDEAVPQLTYKEVKNIITEDYEVNSKKIEPGQVYKVTLKKVYVVLDAQFQIFMSLRTEADRDDLVKQNNANKPQGILTITFNQKYGFIIDNNQKKQRHYLDLNAFNS